MEIILQNKSSSLGMLFGGIALIISLFHFTFGPFNPPQHSLESVVAEHVSAVKKGIIAGLKGETPPVIGEKNTINSDKIVDNIAITLAIVALVCAFIGGMRKENPWSIRGALIFGGGTLAFYAFLVGITIIFAILLLMMICSLLIGAGG